MSCNSLVISKNYGKYEEIYNTSDTTSYGLFHNFYISLIISFVLYSPSYEYISYIDNKLSGNLDIYTPCRFTDIHHPFPI